MHDFYSSYEMIQVEIFQNIDIFVKRATPDISNTENAQL